MSRIIHSRTPLKEPISPLAFGSTRPLNRPADSPTVRVQPPTLSTVTRPRNNTATRGQDPNYCSPYSHSSGMQTSGTAPSSVRFQAGAPPYRPWTQDDQDQSDEQDKQAVIIEIMKSWMDRLKLISLITTFFAAAEGQLLDISTPHGREPTRFPYVRAAANSILSGALVIHMSAAIMSFLAAFFLVRYRLHEAAKQEVQLELQDTPGTPDSDAKTSVLMKDWHMEEVGPFGGGRPPIHLLKYLHILCMWLSLAGFALALAGALCFTWEQLTISAGAFASVCMENGEKSDHFCMAPVPVEQQTYKRYSYSRAPLDTKL
ncbi:hypothetical protein FOMPIDRAFT_1049779 [Fomitopsis schrenkii]|uniref:Uncharacterized protein n=1 Tax=Fomitopsis schrenkii TaxID=2126942 RepID=S8EB14_FOMSC|nr:hypothetical protein FOMPIDRAFT_1049779 [Fomitopsis schrenkii]